MTKSDIEKTEFWTFRVKRGSTFKTTTRYYFTSSRLAKIDQFTMGALQVLDNTTSPPGPLYWHGQEEALKAPHAQDKSTLVSNFILPASRVKKALELQVFLNQENSSVPCAPDKVTLPLVLSTTAGKSQKWAPKHWVLRIRYLSLAPHAIP